jgi:prenyltransferase beta subunit
MKIRLKKIILSCIAIFFVNNIYCTYVYAQSSQITSGLYWLTSTQNSDGGWGFYAGDDSNVYMTAMVSYTLEQFQRTSSIATALNNAMNYLTAHQNSDGGFGSNPSTVYETALAYRRTTGSALET